MVVFNNEFKLYVLTIHKTSCFMSPCSGTPPKIPPPKFPPPCAKFGDFWDPPPVPPFFEVLAPDPLIQDPCPRPSWCSLILWFDLWLWSSIMLIILDDAIIIHLIYNYYRLLSMHQGTPSCIRLHDSSSRVLLQKNTSTLPITMAKSALLACHTA